MAASSGAARAAVSDTRLVSPLAFAEIDLAEALHGVSPTPLSFAANDNSDGETAVASWSLSCGCGCGKNWTSFFRDGVGDSPRPASVDTVTDPLLLDDIGGDSTGAAQPITVGQTIYSVIEDFNDQDFFSITLEAGQTYSISQLLHVGGTATGDGTLLSGVPLADAYIELYGPDGMTLLASADGGSNTTPSGLDAKLFFTATQTGTYFINARSFDQDSTNGTDGDHVGDYTLQVRAVAASEAPLPRFYSEAGQAPNALLDSLDWGSTWDHTVRNPDGDSGTRSDNGVADGGTPITNTEYGIVGKNVMKVYFAKQGDVFLSEDPLNPGLENSLQARNMEQWELDAFRASMDLYEQVTDLQYVEVDNRADADIKIIIYQGTPGAGASLLGRMSPPGEQNEGQMEINAGDYRWTEEGVSPGGFFFPTLLHEFGHGHGMKHPHDNGGGGPTMRGAEPSDDPVEGAIGGQYGDFGLSQQMYTIMSYNDGWNETGGVGGRPAGHGGPSSGGLEMQADHFGWMGTLGALDIALLQDKYGVNEEWATGDDVYTIDDVNGAGHYYRAIWDGGGDDEIRYAGSRNATIDLRAATLQYEEGGGGRVSYALGAWTGFTIANGVTIERATGGDGNDSLTGNDAANILAGGLGTDVLNGEAGDDSLIGGGGADTLNGGAGLDTADYASAAAGVSARLAIGRVLNDGSGAVDILTGIENVTGSAFADTLFGDASANVLLGGGGRDTLMGNAGDDVLGGGLGDANTLYGGTGDDRFLVEVAGDTIVEFAGEGTDTVETGLAAYELRAANVENLVLTAAGGATGTGNALANVLTGGAGDDVLIGRGGADTLRGGAGRDTASYAAAAAAVTVKLAGGVATADGDGSQDVLVSIENVVGSAFDDMLAGDAAANRLDGGAGRDTLIGLAGDDVLSGGGGAANQLYGGAGDDRYIVSAIGDTVVENAGEGVDTVETTLGGFTLRANVENLIYTGSGNFAGVGNASANVIAGGAGADTLTGGGGDDTLNGGAGNDLAVLSGVRADYTVVQEADGVYRVTDGVGGRDGVDLLTGVERVRFSDGSTVLLSDLAGPASTTPLSASAKGYDAEVLPGLSDDDFIVLKGADEPLILPGDGLIDEIAAEGPAFGRFGGEGGRMLTLFDEGADFLFDPAGLLKATDGLDDWM